MHCWVQDRQKGVTASLRCGDSAVYTQPGVAPAPLNHSHHCQSVLSRVYYSVIFFCSLLYVQTCRFRWWTSYTTRGRPFPRRRHVNTIASTTDDSDPIPISTQQHSFTVLVRSGHNLTRAFIYANHRDRPYLFIGSLCTLTLLRMLCRIYTLKTRVMQFRALFIR